MIWKLRKLQSLKPHRIRELQSKKLRALIKHSYSHVPYYHSLLKEVGMNPDDIKNIDDLSKIPILKKDYIRNGSSEEITAANIDLNKCYTLTTSGTTGAPMHIYWEKKARWVTYLQRYVWQMSCGDKATNKRVVIGVWWMKKPPQPIQKLGIFKTKRVSPFEDPQKQIELIKEFGPETVIAWPSCLKALGKEIRGKDTGGINLRFVFTGGELLDEYTRNFIRETFDAEVFDNYGANEVDGISRECVGHTAYHVWSNSIIVEITKDGETLSTGEEGEITVTNLDNYAMPFIRYNLEDLGILLDDECPCGVYSPLMRITRGRKSDVVQLPNGGAISALGVYSGLNVLEGVRQFQVTQEEVNRFTVKIVKDSGFTDETYAKVRQVFTQKIGRVEVDVSVVDTIPREKSGKFKPFITRIQNEARAR